MNGSVHSSSGDRKCFLDVLRIAAAFAVVVFHVLGSSVHNDPSVPLQLQEAVSRVKALLGWPVPVFFMISGFLWLHPDKPCTYARIMPHIRRFVLVLFTVGYAYALMERIFHAGGLSVRLFALSLGDVFTGNLWDHMWYLYAAAGVYLILPVLKPFFDTQSCGSIWILTALLWFFTVAAPFLEEAFGYVFPVDLPLTAPLFYVCAGGLAAKLRLSRAAGLASAGVFLICCILLLASSLFHPLLTSFAAVCAFVAAGGLLANCKSPKPIRILGECSFGIYLFQQFFINVMIKALHIYPLRAAPALSIPLAGLAVYGLSFLTTYLFRRIPLLRRSFF